MASSPEADHLWKYVTDTAGACLLGDSKTYGASQPTITPNLFDKYKLGFLCVAGSILASWGYSYKHNKALIIKAPALLGCLSLPTLPKLIEDNFKESNLLDGMHLELASWSRLRTKS